MPDCGWQKVSCEKQSENTYCPAAVGTSEDKNICSPDGCLLELHGSSFRQRQIRRSCPIASTAGDRCWRPSVPGRIRSPTS